MEFEHPIQLPVRVFALVLSLGCGFAMAEATAIYACTDANGKHITSDRPIAECHGREQRLLNADGSTRQILRPILTADERAEQEAAERSRAVQAAANADAVKSDRNLRARYPNEPAHQRARTAALDDLKRTLQLSQLRLDELAAERKPLQEEAEFYTGRQMPSLLKQQIDTNEAAVEAQRVLLVNQQAESARINATFDAELVRLRAMWAGGKPGALPVVAPSDKASAPATAANKPTK
jgi:Domain of unknown function (DUF4124)